MNYDFGHIIDARNAPGINHFILVVGEIHKKEGEVIMYYIITSRVYAVFKSILLYFNDCLSRNDKNFLKFYNKEKGKTIISTHGHLSQAVFLDKETNYNLCLDTESMVVINSDPRLIDKSVLEVLKDNGEIMYKDRLTKLDTLNLIQTIRHSNEVSPDKKSKISESFSKIKDTLK